MISLKELRRLALLVYGEDAYVGEAKTNEWDLWVTPTAGAYDAIIFHSNRVHGTRAGNRKMLRAALLSALRDRKKARKR